jgi:predicted membrane channel-forming protein YqfA (hemolysin III family)
MGWFIIIAVDPLFDGMTRAGIFWLVAGGLFYGAEGRD